MFNKVFEEKFNNSFIKGYESIEGINILDIIKMLQNLNITINNVHVNEDADLGLKTFQGNYSLDEFLIKYNTIKNDIDDIILYLENDIRLYLNNKNYISLSSSEDIDLNDLLSNMKRR